MPTVAGDVEAARTIRQQWFHRTPGILPHEVLHHTQPALVARGEHHLAQHACYCCTGLNMMQGIQGLQGPLDRAFLWYV